MLGGADNGGTVFEITPNGALATLLSFDGKNGALPVGYLIQASNGDFYGTTAAGGANGDGTFFEITPNGKLTTLLSFTTVWGQTGHLVLGTDGNIYGETEGGGANGDGTIFQVTPGGTLTTEHSLDSTDGNVPIGALVQGTDGDFYGTTDQGGANNLGTVFKFSMGLGPFVKTEPAFGIVGADVKILGNELTGATEVTFNGTVASFTVVSSSEISTTVPTGATTGEVKVVTPSGTLSSHVNFRVSP